MGEKINNEYTKFSLNAYLFLMIRILCVCKNIKWPIDWKQSGPIFIRTVYLGLAIE